MTEASDSPVNVAVENGPSMGLMRPGLFRALIVFTLIAGLGWTWMSRPAAHKSAPSQNAALAPALDLPMLGGGRASLDQLRGKVVLLNFWATWCPPCQAEMPDLNEAQRALKDQGLVVLGVNQLEAESTVQQFIDEHQLSFPIALDGQGLASNRYRVSALPTTFIIDRAGHIHEVIYGGTLTRPLIESKVRDLLNQQ